MFLFSKLAAIGMRPSEISEVREFMSRDYLSDVHRLNILLNNRGNAGLQEVPPIPFTGDIDSMERGNCIFMIGINPHFPALSRDAHINEIDPIKQLIQRFHEGNETSYLEFIKSRLSYFQGSMANWVHYDGIGAGYAENFFPNQSQRSVWRKNVFAADILPYWSTDTGKISLSKLGKNIDKDPALILHQKMLSKLIEEIQPSMVHINGISAGRLVNKLYCNEDPLKPWGMLGEEHNLMFGKASFGNFKVPVMTHNQFGQWGPKKRHWPEFAAAWSDWRSSQQGTKQ